MTTVPLPAAADTAILGTGLLGSGFARGALARGERVAVWNRTAAKAAALASDGARVADSPADAVRHARAVHLVLSDDEAVDAVLDACRHALPAGTPVLDHTTTLPARTAERTATLAAEGVCYVHAPVFINPTMAAAGRGTVLCAGPRAFFAVAEPFLDAMAERVVWLGEDAGRAAAYKLCGNALIVGITALMADVFAVARGAGIPAPEAMRLFEFYDPAGVFRGRGSRMAHADFAASFELTMAGKDVRLMRETARGADVAAPTPVLDAVAARIDALVARGYGADDLAVVGIDAVRPDDDR